MPASGQMHILWGHLAADPVLRTSQGGKSITKLRIGIDIYKGKGDGREKVDTDWYTVTAFGDYADFLAGALHKGSAVKIWASNLKIREWDGQDGTHHVDREVVVENGDVTIIQYAPRRGNRPAPEPHQEELMPGDDGEAGDEPGDDADIPF